MHTSAALLSMMALIAACILSSCTAICNPDNCSRDPCSDNIPNECKGAVRHEIFRKCPQEREHFAKCRISDKIFVHSSLRCEPDYCACKSTYYDEIGLSVCQISHEGRRSVDGRRCDPPPPCAFPDCPPGEMYVPEGECCPKCRIGGSTLCASVTCPAVDCPDSASEGGCCTICKSPAKVSGLDCRAVRCARPECAPGFEAVQSGCCPSCQPIETKVTCFSRQCDTVCIDGYDIDENGCNSCRCKSALLQSRPSCPPVCAIYCPYGNVRNANGCPTCHCNTHPQILPRPRRE